MKLRIAFASFAALVALAAAPSAHAQVVIQGQVTVGTQPTYGQPTYGQPTQPTYGQPYAQPTQPTYDASPYVVQPTAAAPQPIRYVHRSAATPALFVPGIILLAGGYLTEVVGAPIFASDVYSGVSSDWLGFAYIPLLGPWLQLTTYDDIGRAVDRGDGLFSILDGTAQAVGLVMLVLGLTIREEWDEPVYALGDAPDAPRLAFSASSAPGGGAYASVSLQHF